MDSSVSKIILNLCISTSKNTRFQGLTPFTLHALESATSFAGKAAHVVGHGVTGGAANVAMGGKFQDGFLSAAAGAAATHTGIYGKFKGAGPINAAGRTAVAGIIGGTASALGGGKFANGAWTAAFQHLLNWETGSYWGDVGQFMLGVGDAGVGTVTGLAYAIMHPSETGQALSTLATDAIDGAKETFTNFSEVREVVSNEIGNIQVTNRGVGNAVGQAAITAATMGTPASVSSVNAITAGQKLVVASSWAAKPTQAVLTTGKWAVTGRANGLTYLKTGLWGGRIDNGIYTRLPRSSYTSVTNPVKLQMPSTSFFGKDGNWKAYFWGQYKVR